MYESISSFDIILFLAKNKAINHKNHPFAKSIANKTRKDNKKE